ncbi:MAG: Gfo/Idh/MocA family oxidoreductase [Thermodesulfobacteriota bacterium]
MGNLKVGVIGTGNHGSRYAKHIGDDIDGLELSAVCRRSGTVFEQAEKWGCRGYQDYHELISDKNVEALVVVVPPMLNLDIVKAATTVGKPLLVEKPLAGGVEDGEEIVALCRKTKTPLTVGQTLRYNQVVQRLKGELPKLGRLYSFNANQRLEPSSLDWHEDPVQAGAGVSFHTAVHVIDAISFISGLKVKRVLALARSRHNHKLEDLLTVMVEMEGGVLGTLDCSKVAEARSGSFEFVCEEGQLHGEQVHNRISLIHGMEREVLDPGPVQPTIIPILEQWRDYLAGTANNPVSGEEGLAALKFCDACLRSSASDSWVNIIK